MTRLMASKARADFADMLNRVAYTRERIVLRRRGKDMAALVPVEDLELIERLEDRLDLDLAREALKESGRKRPISWERIKRELGL